MVTAGAAAVITSAIGQGSEGWAADREHGVRNHRGSFDDSIRLHLSLVCQEEAELVAPVASLSRIRCSPSPSSSSSPRRAWLSLSLRLDFHLHNSVIVIVMLA
ncbi:hypothetical protein SAY87_031485 [Trapa incisa]|uniref:Uncharacterized protein n=1 Tax=Trapa incisa TaxID=236973 RepID=A0AAN7KKL3_9MYRT|nr:hypothetical protein SAY87_031485 [Trapa incisa]